MANNFFIYSRVRSLELRSYFTKNSILSKVWRNLSNLSSNTVIISKSHVIYENLALEDWIYENYDLTSKNMYVLLMWYNSPSVVIGRYQNPWVECSVEYCDRNGINIARRKSGGGTVFHDMGNLNLSFMTPSKKTDRKQNLELICEALKHKWPLCLEVSKRYDILCNDMYKISGTASKHGRNNAYHHCTLLVNVNEMNLHYALHRDLEGIDSLASSSVRSNVINLNSVNSNINISNTIETISETYQQTYEVCQSNVLQIFPCEAICPGMTVSTEKLKCWDWKFGQTPNFKITKNFIFPPELQSIYSGKNNQMKIIITINKGIFETINLEPQVLSNASSFSLNQIIIGSHFSYEIENALIEWEENSTDDLCSFVKECILKIVVSVFK